MRRWIRSSRWCASCSRRWRRRSSNNWGYINNPKFDELVTKARQTFDPAARDAALAELHAASVDDAAFLYVAHDVSPRAMSPKVKGFVQPKSWFVDFSPMSMAP